jgi:molybdate transport system substrate-binding protein
LPDLPALPRVAIGNPALVPAGMYAQESLQSLGLWDALEAQLLYGETVRQVLAWVEAGEVPAGIVFVTDAQTSQRVQVAAEIPSELHTPIRYPIAVLRESHAPELAASFVAFVTGPEGQAILANEGFSPPVEGTP